MYTLINSEGRVKDEEEVSAELERIRNSIVYANQDDFHSRKQKFEKKDTNMTSFLKETHTIFDSYEKEIEFLRSKLAEMEKETRAFPERKLEVVNCLNGNKAHKKLNFEILSDPKQVFLNAMKYFTEKDPTLNDIAMAYNDKISELFDENEKLQNMLKNQEKAEKEIQALLEKTSKLTMTINSKNDEIKGINETYQEKFREIFSENSNLQNQIQELTKKIDDMEKEKNDMNDQKSSEESKYNTENKHLKDILVKNETKIKDYEEKIERLEKSIEELKKVEQEYEKRKLEANKLEISNTFDEFLVQRKEQVVNIDLQENKSKFEMEGVINIDFASNKKAEDKEIKPEEIDTNEEKENIIREKEAIIKENEEIIKDNEEVIARLEKKYSLLNQENENLREIITKDQIRLKELKDFKEKSEKNNEEQSLMIDENNLLKKEIELFKHRVEEEIAKAEDANRRKEEMRAEKDDLQKEIVKREKIIENNNKVIEDLKDKIREKEDKSSSNGLINTSNYSMTEINPNTRTDFSQIIERDRESTLSRRRSIITTSFDQYALTKELMIDYLYYLYLYDNSINLQQIVDVILKNFNLYMCSIFQRKEDSRSSFSLLHEFLEDIFLVIYDTFIKSKMNQSEVKNIKNDMWIINSEDINLDIIKEVSKEIQKSNIISLVNSINKKEKTIDDIIEIFLIKYEKMFEFSGNNNTNHTFSDFICKEVRPIVVDKIERYKKVLCDELQTLIEYSVGNFHGGKILFNNKQVYDFKEFFIEYLNRDVKVKESLHVKEPLVVPEAIDNIVFSIKHNCGNLKTLYFNKCYQTSNLKTDSSMARVSLTMIMYCPKILNLTLRNCTFSDAQITYLVKTIEFLKFLKLLDLTGNDIKENGVRILSEGLKNNKSLLQLYLDKNNIQANGGFYLADALIKNHSIEKLSLAHNQVNENGLASLLTVLANNNHSIKYLDLSDNHLTNEDFISISELVQNTHSVSVLNLSNNCIEQQSAHYLGLAIKYTQRLNVLYLQNTNLNEESAPLLLKNLVDTKVSELYLDYNPFGEIIAILLANTLKNGNLTGIRYLSLKKCKLTPMSLTCLAKIFETNSFLEGLNLEENTFDDKSISALHKNIAHKNLNVKIYLTAANLSSKAKEMIKNTNNYVLK